jgi:hypothetical protein
MSLRWIESQTGIVWQTPRPASLSAKGTPNYHLQMHSKLIFRVAIASLFYYITQQEINATKPANLLHHNSMKKSRTLYLSLTITGISLLINIPAYGKSHAIQSTSTYAFLGIGSLIIVLLIFIAIKIYKKNPHSIRSNCRSRCLSSLRQKRASHRNPAVIFKFKL